MSEFEIFRALPDHEIALATEMKGDLLSEAMSRVMASSQANKKPYFVCWSENPLIAYRYSKKTGYSGRIASIKVSVKESGELTILGNDVAEVYRTWNMIDWLFLAQKSNWPKFATNVNYSGLNNRRLADIITYKGRKSPRAYAHSDFGLIVHASEPLAYHILTDDEVTKLLSRSRIILRSYKFIRYDFSDSESINAITGLVKEFENENQDKAYNRIMLEQLKALVI